MSDLGPRPTKNAPGRFAARRRPVRVVGAAVGAIVVVACSGGAPSSGGLPVSPATSTASAAPTAVPLSTAPDAEDEAAARSSGRAAPATLSAPTSTWVVFEEADPEAGADPWLDRWPVLDRVRVPQAEGDTKGAGFWLDQLVYLEEDSGFSGDATITRHSELYVVNDLCQFDTLNQSASGAEPLTQSFMQMLRSADCSEQEGLGVGEGRWRVVDNRAEGVYDSVFRTKREAIDAAIRDRGLRTLPMYARPLGFLAHTGVEGGAVNALRYGEIRYGDPDVPTGEMRVLAESVAVSAGSLRGLVRNWSRTLWAWDMTVQADGRSFRWPLTVQPGEVAPFEIDEWDGPADPAMIGFKVTADMSNDMDLSRGFRFASLQDNPRTAWNCPGSRLREDGTVIVPSEVLDGYAPDACLREVHASGLVRSDPRQGDPDRRLSGPSHPSVYGRLAPGLIADLRAYHALFDDRGRVTDLVRLTPFFYESYLYDAKTGFFVTDENGEFIVEHPGAVVREYPSLKMPSTTINVLLDVSSLDDAFLLWIGGASGSPG